MERAGKCLLGGDILRRTKFLVKLAETRPIGRTRHVHKRREIVAGVVAHISISCFLGRIDEEILDTRIDGRHVLKARNEGPYVLEGRAANQPRSRVLQEAKVAIL